MRIRACTRCEGGKNPVGKAVDEVREEDGERDVDGRCGTFSERPCGCGGKQAADRDDRPRDQPKASASHADGCVSPAAPLRGGRARTATEDDRVHDANPDDGGCKHAPDLTRLEVNSGSRKRPAPLGGRLLARIGRIRTWRLACSWSTTTRRSGRRSRAPSRGLRGRRGRRRRRRARAAQRKPGRRDRARPADAGGRRPRVCRLAAAAR